MTYEATRGGVTVYSAIRGAEVPLLVGTGLIESIVDVSEDTVRLVVRGRDAFLTPRLDPGPVTYLAGPLPVTAPLPVDPCAPSPPPSVIPGAPAPEPDDADSPGEGIGPEAPDAPPPPPGGGVAIVTYGRAYWGSTGHIAKPGNNPVTDSETNSEITRIPTLAVEYLVSWQNAVGIINLGSDTWDERFAVFYITRTPSVPGTHVRVTLALDVAAVSNAGVGVGFNGTDADPDLWETANDIRHAATVSIGAPVPAIPNPVPSADWGPLVFEMAVGAVRTLRLYLNATPGPLVGGDYAKGEATLSIQDVEFFTPPPTTP